MLSVSKGGQRVARTQKRMVFDIGWLYPYPTILILRSLVVAGHGIPVVLSYYAGLGATGSVQDRRKVVTMSLGGAFVHLPKPMGGIKNRISEESPRRERLLCTGMLDRQLHFAQSFGNSRLLDYSKTKYMIGKDSSHLSGT